MSEQRARYRRSRTVISRTRGNIESNSGIQHDDSVGVKNTTRGSITDNISNNGASNIEHNLIQTQSRGHYLSKSIPGNLHRLAQDNTTGSTFTCSTSSFKNVSKNVDGSERNTLNAIEAEDSTQKDSFSMEENGSKHEDDGENDTNKNEALSKCMEPFVRTNTSPISGVSKTEYAYNRQISSDGIKDIPTKTLYNRVKRYQGKLGNLRRQGNTKGDQINTIKQVVADIQNELDERRLAARNKKDTHNTYDIDDKDEHPIRTNTSNDLFRSKTHETRFSRFSAKSSAENVNINEDTSQDALDSVEIELLFNGIENLLKVKERPKIQRANPKAAYNGTNELNAFDGGVWKNEKNTPSTGTRCKVRNSTISVENTLLDNSKMLRDEQNTESKQKEPKVNEVYRFMVKKMDGKGRPEMVASKSGLFPQQYDTEHVQMRGKSSCRKHNIHSRQPPEKHKTKTRKQHECKWLKNTEDTQKKQTFIKGKMGVPPWNGTRDDTVICDLHLSIDCSDTQCRLYHNRHTKLPYVWQVKLFGDWIILGREEIQENVERNYCNLKDMSATYLVTYEGVTATIIVKFNNNRIYGYMKVDNEDTYQPIEARRLSTPSYAKTRTTSSRFKTQWRWYWKDDIGEWSEYEEDTMQYTLETKYLAGQTELSSTREDYKYQYVIDFQRMTQTNQRTKRCRDILRRPLLLTSSGVRHGRMATKLRPFPVIDVPLPNDWVPWDHTNHFELVKLPSACRAYKDTVDKFSRTMSVYDVEVDCVYRVQSHVLWDEFCRTKRHMTASLERTRPGTTLDRRDLFHDVENMEDVRRVCTHNFDQSVAGKHDTAYGDGVLFARDATYSDKFTEGPTRLIFLAHVLVGQFTRDDREYRRPPPYPGSRIGVYDSCVNTLYNPSLFRLFEKNQCYPAYLIQYRHRERYIGETRSHISSSQQSINLKRTPSTRSYYGPRPPSPHQGKTPTPTPSPTINRSLRTTWSTTGAQGSDFSGSTRMNPFGETIRSSHRTSYHLPMEVDSPPINRSRPSTQSAAWGRQSQAKGNSQTHLLDQSKQSSPSRFHSDTPLPSTSTGATGSMTRGSQKLPCGCSVVRPPSQSPSPKPLSPRLPASRPSSQPVGYSPLSTTHASIPMLQGNSPSSLPAQPTTVPRASATPSILSRPLPSLDKPRKKKRCSIM